jgi:ribosomal RNA assembly protein
MEEIIKIPAERMKVIIGERGETKRMLEEKCNIRIEIIGDEEIQASGETADVYFSKNIIIAIGRGFNPDIAIRLLKQDYQFELLHLKEYLPTENAIKRIKGRVIGEKGKTRIEIEDATDAKISVYGNTIGIIAKTDGMEYAKEAIEKLIHGANHAGVYRYLAGVRKRLFEERLKSHGH